MIELVYTVRNGRIYRKGAIQHETETKVFLQYYDGQEVKLNLIHLPGAIEYDGRIFTPRLRNRKDPVVYDELITTDASKIDADAIRRRSEEVNLVNIPSAGNDRS
jgi:hypothetical protein